MLEDVAARRSIEHAVAVVRGVLGALSAATILSVGATGVGAELIGSVAAAAAIVLAAVLLGLVGPRFTSIKGGSPLRSAWLIQALDTAAAVGLVYRLEGVLSEAAWVLLVVPIVVAALRLNDVAVVATWFVASAGYLLCIRLDRGRLPAGSEAIAERLAILLVVAASVALLTRWLQEGWRTQAELTGLAEQRIERLAVVEEAARSMRTVDAGRVLQACLGSVCRLGFEAATAVEAGVMLGSAGAGEIVPSDAVCDRPEPGHIDMIRWQGPDGEVLYSASVLEPLSGAVIAGWTKQHIDEPIAQALADLVYHATNALEAARHLARARYEASHDPLTALANRAELHRYLDAAAASAEPAAVVFVDLDRFKEINDTHGHLVGDRLLAALAGRLTNALGGRGLAARFGGDEFVIVLTGDVAAKATALAEELRKSFAHPFRIDHHDLTVTASIGVAAADAVTTPQQLLRQADQAAYAAKHAGRNQVRSAGAERAPVAGNSPHDPRSLVSHQTHQTTPNSTDNCVMDLRQQSLTIHLIRATAIATALLMVTILTVSRSQAAFTATTSNTASSFTTGTVILTDDDAGVAMFTASGMTPANPIVECVTVTYSGSQLPAPVRLYGTTTGTLDTYLATTIEIGTGGSFGDCTGFTPTSTLFNNTLANFSTTHTNWASGLATFTAAGNPTSRTFRITIDVQNNPLAQGLTSTADFIFETQA